MTIQKFPLSPLNGTGVSPGPVNISFFSSCL
ncbi:hypothetical protein GBAR_LOCUS26573, partial [Geodia barretti]